MYRTFYGLKTPPFSSLPNIRFLYLNENRRRVLGMAGYAVRERAGFCVISGKAGVGKTILIHALIKRLGNDVHAGLVTCLPGSSPSCTELIATAFDIDTSNSSSKEMYQRIKDYIADLGQSGKRALLIIDNAHNLKLTHFKMLVHLADIEDSLQVILVGHPELRQQFCRQELGESAPDSIIQTTVSPLNRMETSAYIRRRIVTAGGAKNLFSESACETVFRFSRGVPGLINCACNYALEAGYENKHPIIDKSIISDLLKNRHESNAVDFTDDQQNVTASSESVNEEPGVKSGPETATTSSQDIINFVRLSTNNQRRLNRRLAYATLAGILVPVTVAVWLFFQLRPGEHIEPGGETQIASDMQPAKAQFDNETPQDVRTTPPSLEGLSADSKITATADKLVKNNVLNQIKKRQREMEDIIAQQHIEQARIKEAVRREKEMQRELENRLAEQRVEQARIKEAMQREQERITEAMASLNEVHKAGAAPVRPVEVPLAQDGQIHRVPAGYALPDETEKLEVIADLKQRQYKLERRIAQQRIEYNWLKKKIGNERERIIKARVLIKKAYKSARLIWDQYNNATPEPYPEDRDQL